jgi:3-hydroxyisobutyrate dehydrogenase
VSSIVFLGTGTMGLPMARNLALNGFKVRAWNRTPERARALVEDGVEVFEDPRTAATGCTVLVTMMSEASAVLDSAPPALAALERSERSAIWLQTSTIGVEGTELCAELADRHGVQFVDAPVLGTRKPAQDGELVILGSGPDEALDSCEVLFGALGSRTLRLGPAGAGTRCKLAVNSWIVGLTAVLAETISLAEALEIEPRRFFEAIDGGPLDVPYARLKGEAMIQHDFSDVAFRLALAAKDADLVLGAAQERGLEVPVMRAVAERIHRVEKAGHGDDDMAATYLATASPDSALAAGTHG